MVHSSPDPTDLCPKRHTRCIQMFNRTKPVPDPQNQQGKKRNQHDPQNRHRQRPTQSLRTPGLWRNLVFQRSMPSGSRFHIMNRPGCIREGEVQTSLNSGRREPGHPLSLLKKPSHRKAGFIDLTRYSRKSTMENTVQ